MGPLVRRKATGGSDLGDRRGKPEKQTGYQCGALFGTALITGRIDRIKKFFQKGLKHRVQRAGVV